ncbi:MoaD/ThiS family protein [Corynebacterium terpenotabidum]|uniref:Molybdopterin biosynthesis protein MoaD2 n=1 Tax=Corynebacterium terpenotabidum Y-11 TaxID=1200352 RepID=S4XLU1_9CORY|nr:MoaD/ThiS family protein [Corynebacterium terpenotabidum]AGP31563.1 molybdopterin biosynthesis protein MoaD2 [Corynebacterium terpenotabidum Y-11]
MVEIRYFAAARAARGVPQETVDAPATLATLLDDLGARHTDLTAGGMTLAQIFDRCSFLVDGRSVTRPDADAVDLDAVTRVDVLPPFAGG